MTKGWGADKTPLERAAEMATRKGRSENPDLAARRTRRAAPVKNTRVSERTQNEADKKAPRDRQVIQSDGSILIVNNELGKYESKKRR